MPFVNGYPTEGDIKPALYINDPRQTHDLIQSFVPAKIRAWLNSLMDERHHFYGVFEIEHCYIIERYTEEDYKYAHDFSLQLYEFHKYLSSFRYVITPHSTFGQSSNLNFGDWFSKKENIDATLYNRDFTDLLTINLPSSDNPEDWVTITYYETLPWIVDHFWTYLTEEHARALSHEETLLTKSDLIFFDIPDSRENKESVGSRINFEVEDPKHEHYIQLEYKYPLMYFSTNRCLSDPIARRYNLANKKFSVRGQEIKLNTRWFVAYTMVIDSNNSAIIDQVKSQIPEQYLYENFQGYLELLKSEIEQQHQSKKILKNFHQTISFTEDVSLSNIWQAVYDNQSGYYITQGSGNHTISVNYAPAEPSYQFDDINHEAHFFANLVYGNNNLYNNSYGDTSTYQDLGIGIHIKRVRNNAFRLDNGTSFSLTIDQVGGGVYLDINRFYEVVSTGGGQREGIVPSAYFDKRNNYSINSTQDEQGNMELVDDEPITYLRCFKAYRFYNSVSPLLNSLLYSQVEIPSLVFGDIAVKANRNEDLQWVFDYEEVLVQIKASYNLDDGSRTDLSEYPGIFAYNAVHRNWNDTEDITSRTFFGLADAGYVAPDGVVNRRANIFNLGSNSPPKIFELNHSLNHSWAVSATGTVRTSPQPRDFSSNLEREQENITAFNTLYFEECSCMSAQIAQEILDLVKEIHASLDAGKYAYQEDGETKRVANLGYYAERIARVLGISVNPDGSIRSIRQAKLIESGDSIPAGWNLGQFGRNQGGNSVGQTGGSESEDRDGLAYAVRSNSFGTDPFTGEANLIKEGGYVLVENIPQLLHLMLDDLDRAFGLQNAGANVIPSPNGELIPIQGINNILLELLYTAGQTNKSASKTHISSLITQAIAKEILQALGVPLTIKKLPVKIDSNNQGYIPIPGTTNRSASLVDLQLLSLINIASILKGQIDFKTEDLEKENES